MEQNQHAVTTMLGERELQLAREAAEWRLLSLLFECPNETWRANITALAAQIDDAELKTAVEDALNEASEGLYHHTFGPGGPAPAREATYRQTVQLGYLMAELQAFYNAFAYAPVTAEAPDHIAVETGFIAYLKIKEAYALACGDQERAATAAESAQKFIDEHLKNIAHPLAGHLESSEFNYLVKAGSALASRVGPPARAVSPFAILHEEESEGEMACGANGINEM